MRKMSAEELKDVKDLQEVNVDGLEFVKSAVFKEHHLSVWYDGSCDYMTVQIVDAGRVTHRWVQCNGIEAVELVLDLCEEILKG